MNGCNVALVVFPFSSQVLQFVNENGVVNIYMLVLSYMFSPNTDIDEEIVVDDEGNVSVSSKDDDVKVVRHASDSSDSKEEEITGSGGLTDRKVNIELKSTPRLLFQKQ